MIVSPYGSPNRRWVINTDDPPRAAPLNHFPFIHHFTVEQATQHYRKRLLRQSAYAVKVRAAAIKREARRQR